MQSTLGLQVTLAPQVPANVGQSPFAIPVEVSIHNPAEHPVTFLSWGTPLDTSAGPLGVFSVCDTENGESLPMTSIKISRKLPPSYEDLVEVSAHQTVEKTVRLPPLQLEKGHEYSLYAQGIWHAIWDKPIAEISTADLENLADANRGDFRSNSALLKAQ